MSTLYYSPPQCRLHDMGPCHPECPARVDAIADHLRATGLDQALVHEDAPDATAEQLAASDRSISLPAKAARFMTPAFVCLLVVEGSDVLFAFDSVPAVIAVTQEPLLVYTAMIFAILGLRSLYFILLVLTRYLAHLEKAIIYVLFFIAAKMFAEAYHKFHELGWVSAPLPVHVTPETSMAIVLAMLALGVVASFVWPAKEAEAPTAER